MIQDVVELLLASHEEPKLFFLRGSHWLKNWVALNPWFICTYVKQIKCVHFEYVFLKTGNLTSVFQMG